MTRDPMHAGRRTPSTDREQRLLPAWRRGFTLAEGLMASVVLALAVTALSGTLTASISQSSSIDADATAIAFARCLMEEIAARPFSPPAVNDREGYKAGNSDRSTYDDIGDYHGYHEASPIMLSREMAVTNGTYSRDVTVEFRTTPSGGPVGTSNFAMVTVTVKPLKGREIKLRRLFASTTLNVRS